MEACNDEVPRILGFERGNLLMHNPHKEGLFMVSLDQKNDEAYKRRFPPGTEVDYAIEFS